MNVSPIRFQNLSKKQPPKSSTTPPPEKDPFVQRVQTAFKSPNPIAITRLMEEYDLPRSFPFDDILNLGK